MVTDFMFYNVTRGNEEGQWPDDNCAMERYGQENAKRGFDLVIARNEWDARDTIVAVGDSFGAVLTYENGKIRGLDDGEPISEPWWVWLSGGFRRKSCGN
jgi:hypothetical protein